MGWSKRQIVVDAYGEIGIADYNFDLQPEEMQAAVRKLDTMLASWNSVGIQIGYSFGLTPDEGDLDDDSGIALATVNAVVLNLAVAIAPAMGKALAQTTKKLAKDGYDALLLRVVRDEVQQQQQPTGMPRGAGHRRNIGVTSPFMPPPSTGPLSVDSSGLDFLGS